MSNKSKLSKIASLICELKESEIVCDHFLAYHLLVCDGFETSGKPFNSISNTPIIYLGQFESKKIFSYLKIENKLHILDKSGDVLLDLAEHGVVDLENLD